MRSCLPAALLATFLCACSVGEESKGTAFGSFTGQTAGGPGTATATGGDDGTGSGGSASGGSGTGGGTTGGGTSSGSTGGGECGDGMVQPGEDCEALEFGGQTCADFGFDAGDLICSNACTILTDACYSCGDGTKQAAEACDGTDFGGKTCVSEGFASGSLQCSVDCQTIDTSNCQQAATCGDGQLDNGEQCDGAALGGQTCASLGYAGGSLSCSANCTFNTSQCQNNNPNCLGQGDGPCFADEDCCPPGVNGILLQSCQLLVCF